MGVKVQFEFATAPRIIFFTTLAATFFVPFLSIDSGLTFTGDIVVLLYLLGLGRFFLVLSALDTGSAFEGMGASREVFYAALAEPVLFTCLLVIMREKNMESITAALSAPLIANSVTVLFAAIPLFIVLLAENARIPFDDPTTHLELTMIHEVMILDNSGPGLALLEYAATIKLWLFSTIIARVLLPVHGNGMIAQAAAMLIIIVLIAFIIGMVESLTARVRLLKAPQLLFGAGTIAILGFFFNITGILIW